MTREELWNLPNDVSPLVKLPDGKMGILVSVPSLDSNDDLCCIQVIGRLTRLWFHRDKLSPMSERFLIASGEPDR